VSQGRSRKTRMKVELTYNFNGWISGTGRQDDSVSNTNNTGQGSEDRQELKYTVKMINKWQSAVREVISVHGNRWGRRTQTRGTRGESKHRQSMGGDNRIHDARLDLLTLSTPPSLRWPLSLTRPVLWCLAPLLIRENN